MSTLILRFTTLIFVPLASLFSLFLLLRGHNAPGGGFAAGLTAAAAVALSCLTIGPGRVRRLMRLDPRGIMGLGLAVALTSGFPALALGRPFMTASWAGRVGTPLAFDLGVFLLVFGAASIILQTVAEES